MVTIIETTYDIKNVGVGWISDLHELRHQFLTPSCTRTFWQLKKNRNYIGVLKIPSFVWITYGYIDQFFIFQCPDLRRFLLICSQPQFITGCRPLLVVSMAFYLLLSSSNAFLLSMFLIHHYLVSLCPLFSSLFFYVIKQILRHAICSITLLLDFFLFGREFLDFASCLLKCFPTMRAL